MSSESQIDRQITEIEDYIDSCKYQRFSNDVILVSKEQIGALLDQLRNLTPEEIRHYRRIIDQKDEILEDARNKAEDLMVQATYKFNESLNENAIMQEAYKQADEMVRQGANQSQAILNQAVADANNYRAQAVGYVDGMLAEMEELTARTLQEARAHYEAYLNSLNDYLTTIRNNRAELKRSIDAANAAAAAAPMMETAPMQPPVQNYPTDNTEPMRQ